MAPILGILASAQPGNLAVLAYESIATINGNGSASSVTFSSIPSTYKHLQIRTTMLNTSGIGSVFMEFNADGSGIYWSHSIYGNGTSASSNNYNPGSPNGSIPISGFGSGQLSSTYPTVSIVDILDYANTNKNKTARILTGTNTNAISSNGDVAQLISGSWPSTSAITAIKFRNDYGTAFSTSTSFALYGIKG
jgi:hypothetical protein